MGKKKVIKNYIEEERFENAYIVNEQGENAMWKGNKPIQQKNCRRQS